MADKSRRARFQALLQQESPSPEEEAMTLLPDSPSLQGQPFTISTTVLPDDLMLPPEAEALGEQLLQIARSYLRARRRSGEALLEAARWLSDARQVADEGNWHRFLHITGTGQDTAERLLNIHVRATQSPAFAESIVRGQINQTIAGLLARPSTPVEVIEHVLATETPLKVSEVQRAIRVARQRQVAPEYVDNVDNVDTPQNAESLPVVHSSLTPAPLSPPVALLQEAVQALEQVAAEHEYTILPDEVESLLKRAEEALFVLHDMLASRAARRPW